MNSDESLHHIWAVHLTFSTAHTVTFCCVPAERHYSASLQRQRPRWRPSAGWRLRRVRGGSQRRGADEGGHLPPVLSHRQRRGKPALLTVSAASEKWPGSSLSSIILPVCLTVRLVLVLCLQDVVGCNSSPVEGAESGDDSLVYLCSALSGDDGAFIFPSLPSGEYTVVRTHNSLLMDLILCCLFTQS